MSRKNQLLILAGALVAIALAVIFWWYYTNYGSGATQRYLEDRREITSTLVEAKLSAGLAEAAKEANDDQELPDESLQEIQDACENVKRQIDELPDEAPDRLNDNLEAVETSYPLADLRGDIERYHRLCDYLVKNQQFERDIKQARSADAYGSDAEYLKGSVMPIIDQAIEYHDATECPFALSGSEQLCNGIANHFRNEKWYEGAVLQALKTGDINADNPWVEEAREARDTGVESNAKFVTILGDYETIYDIYVDELSQLESKFESAV